MDFHVCLSTCKSSRAQVTRLFAGVPRNFRFSADGSKVYFLAPPGNGGPCSLFGVSLSEGSSREWVGVSSHGGPRQFSRSEQLLRERMRATGTGITGYDVVEDRQLLFVIDGSCSSLIDSVTGATAVQFPKLVGGVDYKPCPSRPSLAACVVDGDIWLLDGQHNRIHQLTHTAADRKATCITAGQPSFIVQEEFDRYTGFWWQPKGTAEDEGTYRILYEEVDESRVKQHHTFNPSTQSVEDYRYPCPGETNAQSALKMLEFSIGPTGDISSDKTLLAWKPTYYFPQSEYLVRAGWLRDGSGVWVELVDRRQSRLWLASVPLDLFHKEGEGQGQGEGPGGQPRPCLLWQDSSECWINVTDILLFLDGPADSLTFVLSSEASGYRHLYLVHAHLPTGESADDGATLSRFSSATTTSQQLTAGDWVVFENEVWHCKERNLLFFEATASSCLEKNLYCISLDAELPCLNPVQLTPSGYQHSVSMSKDCSMFVSMQSSAAVPPHVVVYSSAGAPPTCAPLCVLKEAAALPATYTPPIFFTVPSESGEELHGAVFSPVGRVEGKKHPTVLFVYGGPHLQVVTQGFSRWLPRIHCWLALGFAVVLVDNRGSTNRGLHFEAHLKEYMGRVEVADQVRGLQRAAAVTGFIDLERVAVTGWSYGGYLSLMCLAQRPDVFKLAMAGAPVVDWKWYDTAYTERYLGVPPATEQAYTDSSVLKYISQLPTKPNRLLILHGLNDENVLFTHTSLLVDQLVALGRPYQLQVYTGERHGLRAPAASAHADATMLSFLLQHL